VVDHLHSHGVAHRDIKLENVLLDENLNVKLGDLGMATDSFTQLRNLYGTPNYMPPEVLERQADIYDACKADVYSLGICLFILLSGQPLYDLDLQDLRNIDS
jgi:serine/threonine protein kinase